jgi:hypothetical protein
MQYISNYLDESWYVFECAPYDIIEMNAGLI